MSNNCEYFPSQKCPYDKKTVNCKGCICEKLKNLARKGRAIYFYDVISNTPKVKIIDSIYVMQQKH